MRKPIVFFLVLILISVLATTFYSFAEEKITLTTYYPAPYGVYREMRTNSLAVGSGYRNIPASPMVDGRLVVNGSVGIGTVDPKEILSLRGPDEMLNFHTGGTQFMASNAYYGAVGTPPTWAERYVDSNKYAEKIHFGDGTITLSVAPSGTANNPIAWKDAIKIGDNGYVNITYPLEVGTNSGVQGAIGFLPGNSGSRYWIDNPGGTNLRFSRGISPNDTNKPMTITENGNVTISGNLGIGTLTPGQKLEVNGKIKITDGNQSYGKVLTSDAQGVASWQAPMQIKCGIASGADGRGGESYWDHTFDIDTGLSSVYNAIAIPQWSTNAGHLETLQQLGVVVTKVSLNTPSSGRIRVNYSVKARWYNDDRVLDVRFVWLAIGS